MQPEIAGEERRAVGQWRWGFVAIVLIAGYLALVAVDAFDNVHLSGDTVRIAEGSRYALDCLADREFVSCGASVAPYPLLQYLPTAVLVTMMPEDVSVVSALGWISLFAYVGILILLVIAGRRLEGRFWMTLLPLVALVAPLPFLATTGLGEMLAAFVVLAAVTASLYRRPWLTFALLVAATFSKETAGPFLVVFAMIVALGPEDRLFPPRRMIVAIVSGAMAGLVATALFNVFRYGVPRNTTYMDPLMRTESVERVAEWFVAQLVSPVGGLLWFWLPAFVVSTLVLIIGVRRLVEAPRDVSAWAPPLLAVLALCAVLGGLSMWWTPFGWITWGPRLVVPMIPAACVVMVKAGGAELGSITKRVLGGWRGVAAVGAVSLVFAWPQLGVPWTWPQGLSEMFDWAAEAGCPILQDDPAGWYTCASKITWKWSPLQAVSGGTDATLVVARILASGAILALLVQSHDLIRSRVRPESADVHSSRREWDELDPGGERSCVGADF